MTHNYVTVSETVLLPLLGVSQEDQISQLQLLCRGPWSVSPKLALWLAVQSL